AWRSLAAPGSLRRRRVMIGANCRWGPCIGRGRGRHCRSPASLLQASVIALALAFAAPSPVPGVTRPTPAGVTPEGPSVPPPPALGTEEEDPAPPALPEASVPLPPGGGKRRKRGRISERGHRLLPLPHMS